MGCLAFFHYSCCKEKILKTFVFCIHGVTRTHRRQLRTHMLRVQLTTVCWIECTWIFYTTMNVLHKWEETEIRIRASRIRRNKIRFSSALHSLTCHMVLKAINVNVPANQIRMVLHIVRNHRTPTRNTGSETRHCNPFKEDLLVKMRVQFFFSEIILRKVATSVFRFPDSRATVVR